MSNQILDIQPRDLEFIFEVKKQSTCSVRVVNKTDFPVAYKVKTTSPKKYCVRPNVGIVKPKSSCDFIVTMQGQRAAPPDLICKDKFLVQSTIVPDGTTEEDITSSTFVKDNGKHVEDSRLRVILVNPPHSPELSSEKGDINQMPDHEATLLKDHVSNGIDITSQQKDHNLEDTKLHKTHITEAITTPSHKLIQVVEIIEDVRTQNYKDSENINVPQKEIIENINVPQKEIIEDIGFQKHMTSEEMNAWKNEFLGDISMQKENTIKETTSSTEHDNEDKGLQKDRTSEDINKWKNDTTGDISMQKEGTIPGIVPPTKHNIEDIPDSKVASISPESVPKDSVVEAVAVDILMKKDDTNLELVKDIETLKSKLNGLESNLREAEITILKLTEERRLSSEELDNLRKEAEITISKLAEERRLSSEELENLRKEVASKSTPFARKSVQAGFPFLYVVMVAFISTVLGYRFHC